MQTFLETAVSNALVASVLALLAFAVGRWRRPALAHGLWLLVLVKLVTPPLLPVYLPAMEAAPSARSAIPPLEIPEAQARLIASPEEITALLALADLSEESQPVEATAAGVTPAAMPAGPSWQECIVPLWLGGTALWLTGTLWSVCRFHWLLRSARLAPKPIQNQTRQLAARLGLARCPQVWLVPGSVSPMIWAIGAAPRLLFPTGLLDRLDGEQRAALLLHELAHVRRRDHWVRFVELLVVALYWWLPVVWWARRELREAEEQCCDAWVVWASAGEGTAYARALLETVAFVSRTRFPLPASASGIGHVPHLRRRLTMIMQANTPKSLSAAGWLLLGLAAFLLPVAARAQAPAPGDGREQEIKALKQKIRALEAGKDLEAVVDVVIDFNQEQAAEREQLMKAAADLKAQIAKKRAELQDMETKLKHLVATMDAGKGKKEVIKEKIKKDIKDGKGANLDLKLDNLKLLLDGNKDVILQLVDPKQLKVLEKDLAGAELIMKKLDPKNLDELKKLGVLKGLDAKKLEEAVKAGIKLNFDKGQQDIKVILDGKQQKTESIELRLERLMKELQDLQKEVKASKNRQGN